ncbi:MAG: hypothetical protein QOF02_213 [Blastocatellia bacterium]|jgi:uncharacterized lipoprotein|nr:hypothetical protein [Blastocatellia bacterium]
MRKTFSALIILLLLVVSLIGCGNNSETSNAESDNSSKLGITNSNERANNSNIAPTGGPGPEPENSGKPPAANSNEKKAPAKTTNKAP